MCGFFTGAKTVAKIKKKIQHRTFLLVQLNKQNEFKRYGSDRAQLFNTNLKCQCKQRECVQSREAHFSSNVGFQQRLVKHVCVRVAIACMDYNTRLLPSDCRQRGWRIV